MSLLLFDCYEKAQFVCGEFASSWEGRLPGTGICDTIVNAVAWWLYMGLPEKDSLRGFVVEYADPATLHALSESVGIDPFVDMLWMECTEGVKR